MRKTILMIFIITVVSVFLSTYCYGQIKCKLEINEWDSFAERRVVETKMQDVATNENLKFGNLKASIRKVSDSTYILKLWAVGGGLGCVGPNSSATFKDTAGNFYTIKHGGDIDCGSSTYVYGQTIHYNPNIVLHLTKEDLKFLKTQIAMVRLDFERYANYNVILPMYFQQLLQCVDNPPPLRGH